MENQNNIETETLIEEIGQGVFTSVGSNVVEGARRRDVVLSFLNQRLPHYATVLAMPAYDILRGWEALRGINNTIAINFYQNYNMPVLDDVQVFDVVQQFTDAYPSHQCTCPQCKGMSTDYYKCNSGKVFKGFTCEWRALSMMGGTKDDYIRIVIKESFAEFPVPQMIFKPIELAPPAPQITTPEIKRLV